MLTGITIQLVNRVKTGEDAFGAPISEEIMEDVKNVLVGLPTQDDLTTATDLTGKKVTYMLGIPKGDTHTWENREIILPYPFSGKFRTVGFSVVAIDDMVPLAWNRKVMVERYE